MGATGIVLAGGRSARFGADKLAAVYRGKPLLHHALLRLSEVCAEIVLVLARDADEPPLPPGLQLVVAHDAEPGEGPLAGLLAGLAEAGSDLAVVAGGDMPELDPGVLRQMLRVAAGGPDAVALAEGDRFRPLPAVVRIGAARDVGRAIFLDGERSIRALLSAIGVTAVPERTWVALDRERRTLVDVDEPSDLLETE